MIAALSLALLAPFAIAVPAQAETFVQGERISVSAIGSGPPVILIPGLSSPRAVWDGAAPALARTHRVYLVQINGFGGDAPRKNLTPGILAGAVAELHALIARERLGRVAVIGHSMGGLTAMMLAKAHPGDVSKLLIVDALPFVGQIFAANATVASLAPQAAAMRDAMAATYGTPANPQAAAAVATGQALTPDARAKVAGWVARADPRVSAQAMWEALSTDLRPDMARIATPITLIYPHSTALPREQADAIYRPAYQAAPDATFTPVADSGHFVMLDQPAAFAAAVREWLK